MFIKVIRALHCVHCRCGHKELNMSLEFAFPSTYIQEKMFLIFFFFFFFKNSLLQTHSRTTFFHSFFIWHLCVSKLDTDKISM